MNFLKKVSNSWRQVSIVFVFFLLLQSCEVKLTKKNTHKFSGNWTYYSKNVKNDSALAENLFISLFQDGEKVEGYSIFVSRNGNKISYFDEKNKNIKGVVKNDTLYIDYTVTFFPEERYKAKLYFSDSILIWNEDFFNEGSLVKIPFRKQ